MYKGLIIVLIILFSGEVMGQKSSSGINIGIKAGRSKMITEITSDFSQHLTEFDHEPGPTLDLEFSKFLSNHFEVGTSINLNILQGNTDYANFTSQPRIDSTGTLTYPHNDLSTISVGDTVKYHNRLLGQRFFVSYYFRDFSEIKYLHQLEPFLRAGLGYIKYATEVKYSNTNETIFGKDVSMFTAIYFLSAGVKTYISPNVYINASYTINYVPSDFLDGMYNYNYSDGSRADMKGLFNEFKIGIFFQTVSKSIRYKKPYLPFTR